MADLLLNVSVGEAQYVTKNHERFPWEAGPFNAIANEEGWQAGIRYPDVNRGTGFLLWGVFTDDGPVAVQRRIEL